MQLFVNHFIAHSDVSSNFQINFCKSLEKAEMVLSSTKLCKLAVLNMEHCGTPESNSLKRLYVLLNLTFCLHRFK